MAGKTTKPKAKENRGGKRAGSGRKPKITRLTWKSTPADMVKAAKKYAKQYGMTVDDILLEVIYNHEDARVRLSAIKIQKEFTIARTIDKKVEITENRAPKIFLPEKKPDPAKVIPIDRGDK